MVLSNVTLLSNKSGLIKEHIQTTTWQLPIWLSSAARWCAGRGCALIRQLANMTDVRCVIRIIQVFNYGRLEGYVLPGVCLFVCLSVCVCLLATSRKNYWLALHENFTRHVFYLCERQKWLNFRSCRNPDPNPRFFPGILQHCKKRLFFHTLAVISEKNDRMFMTILPEMHLSTRRSPLNFESHRRIEIRVPYTDSEFGRLGSPWRRSC